jgi:hypothetical protein
MANIVTQVYSGYQDMPSRESMKRLNRHRDQLVRRTISLKRKWCRGLESGRQLQKRNEISSSCGSRVRLKILRLWKGRKV